MTAGKEALTGDDRRRSNQEKRLKRSTHSTGGQYFVEVDRIIKDQVMTTEDAVDYLHNDIRTCGDPQYLIDGFLKTVDRHHIIGHWDERVAAHETAADNYLQNLIEIMFNLFPMLVHHDLLKSFPTSTTADLVISDGQTGNTTIPHFTKATIDNYVNDLINMQIVVPYFIIEMIKKLNFLVKFTSSQYRFGLTIPATYYYPWLPKVGTTSFAALLAALKADIGKAIKFFNFFGIPTVPFDAKMLEYRVIEVADRLPYELEVWFGNGTWSIYDGANPQEVMPTGPFYAAQTTHKWWVRHEKDKVGSLNDDVMNIWIRNLCKYNGTYNKYGGAFSLTTPTTQNYPSMLRCDQDEATEMISSTVAGFTQQILLYFSSYCQSNTFNVSLTGTYGGGDVDITVWPYANTHGLKYANVNSYVENDGILLKYLADITKFVAVKSKDTIVRKR